MGSARCSHPVDPTSTAQIASTHHSSPLNEVPLGQDHWLQTPLLHE